MSVYDISLSVGYLMDGLWGFVTGLSVGYILILGVLFSASLVVLYFDFVKEAIRGG